MHGGASDLFWSPRISSTRKLLPKAGQLGLRRRSRELPLHQDQSIGEAQSGGVQQHFPQLALATVRDEIVGIAQLCDDLVEIFPIRSGEGMVQGLLGEDFKALARRFL